jgi:hypothetical protein
MATMLSGAAIAMAEDPRGAEVGASVVAALHGMRLFCNCLPLLPLIDGAAAGPGAATGPEGREDEAIGPLEAIGPQGLMRPCIV